MPLPERPFNFAQTCNLLSRYVKEKGSLRDLNIEIGGKVESLEAIVKPGSSLTAPTDSPGKINEESRQRRAIEPNPPGSGVIVVEEDASDTTSTSKEKAISERNPAQLTIFYSGKVLVFDDYPADKARQLVSLAKRSSSQMSYGILSKSLGEKPNPSARGRLPPRPQSKQQSAGTTSNTCTGKPNPSTTVPVSSTSAAPARSPQSSTGKQPLVISSNTCGDKTSSAAALSSRAVQEQPSLQSDASGSDLPIARRSSIHRFLEKRKDRAAARGPYQNPEHPAPPSSSSSKEKGEIDLNL